MECVKSRDASFSCAKMPAFVAHVCSFSFADRYARTLVNCARPSMHTCLKFVIHAPQ